MEQSDRNAATIAQSPKQRGTDAVSAPPVGLDVSAKEWEEAWIAVLDFGLRVTKSLDRAQDIRQQAYLRLLTTRPWTRDRPTTFLKHMLLTASSILKHDAKARSRRERYEAEAGAEYKRERGDSAPPPEQNILEHAEQERSRDRAARILAELRRRLSDFPLELALIDRAEQTEASDDEPETPSELARALGVSIEEVYRARARIKRYKDGVYRAVDRSDKERDDGEA